MAEPIVLKNLYALGKKVKEDNFGTIYNGILLSKRTPITIKEYHKKFCHQSIVDKLQSAVFQLANLSHPNIVRIIDSVFTEQQRFFVIYDTPYEGTLADILAKIVKFPEKEVLMMLGIIGKAIEYAHQKQLIHGALNPENVLMLADGQIKIQNFYIDHLLNSLSLTKNEILLNPVYLAPEQLKNEPVKKTTDVFALGVLAYQLLSGHLPYPEISNIAMILRNLKRKPESLLVRNPDLPKYLEDIIFKAIEFTPIYRQQTILEFLGDLNAKKVTIRVEEIKLRLEMQKQRQAAAAADPEQDRPEEVNLPQHIVQHRQNKPKTYNNSPQPQPVFTAEPNQPITGKALGKKMRKFTVRQIIYIVILCFLIGISISIVQSIYTNYFFSVPKIEIPNITGTPLEEAAKQLEDLGLKFKVIGYVSDSAISKNCVVSTLPEHGRVVKKFRLIKLYVSKGNEQFTVPSLVESNINQVESIIKEKGFALKIVDRVYSTTYAPNIIISQAPEAHAVANKGAEIQVVVSKGYPVFINLVDQSKDTAVLKLSAENLANWEPNNITIYLQTSSGRNKYFEKLLKPGERIVKEITTEPDAVIEVYYFNNLALKQEVKNLLDAADQKNKKTEEKQPEDMGAPQGPPQG